MKMEKRSDSLQKNFLYQSAYQLLSIILPLITTPYISRVLSPEGVGIYSYTNSVMYFFLMAANLGIVNYGTRTVAENNVDKDKLSKTFWGIYFCHLCVSLLCLTAYVVFLVFFCKEYRIAFFCQTFQLIAVLIDITWFFSGIQKFRVTVLRNFIIRLISVALIFLFVKEQDDIWKYILILSVGNIAGQAVVWIQIRSYVGFSKVSIKEICSHLKPMIILFIPIIAMSVYRYMDKIMIPNLNSMSQLGIYENSEKIMSIPLSFITSLGIVLLPKISSMTSAGNTDKTHIYIEYSMEFALILASAMTFGLIGIAPVFAPVFLGDEFKECGTVISAIALTIYFLTWSNTIRSQYLIPKRKDGAFIIAAFSGAVVNLVLNLIFIKPYGALGAVIGTICAELTVAILHTFFARKELNIRKMLLSGTFYLIPGIFMMIIVRMIGRWMGNQIITLIIQIAVGAVLFIGISILYMHITHNRLWLIVLSKIKNKIKKK